VMRQEDWRGESGRQVVARHRSPSGRGAPFWLQQPAVALAGGAGGAHRSVPFGSGTAAWQRGKVAATAVLGSVLAITASAAITETISDRQALRLAGADPQSSAADVTADPFAPSQPLAPVASAARPAEAVAPAADAAALVKAIDLAKAAPSAALPAVPALPVPSLTAVAGAFVRPVSGVVTSGFGSRGGSPHFGLDIANKIGTPIRSVAAGEVVEAGPASGFGLWVQIAHDDGTTTVYGHVNRFFVKPGQQVKAGQVIAEVGNRGQSTGPHLHLEVWDADGSKINPRTWLVQRGVRY
jgi:murein DD-endopeptidase MepM/ murein hydrolase activator NlpD